MTTFIKIKIIRVPGSTQELEVVVGKDLQSIFDDAGINIDFTKETVAIGNNIIQEAELNIINKFEGAIIIAQGAKGQAPTPKIKSVVKYLKSNGYIENGGKGDHRKFSHPHNMTILLNPDNNDHKHLDLGSAKSLAKALGLNLTTLYDKFS